MNIEKYINAREERINFLYDNYERYEEDILRENIGELKTELYVILDLQLYDDVDRIKNLIRKATKTFDLKEDRYNKKDKRVGDQYVKVELEDVEKFIKNREDMIDHMLPEDKKAELKIYEQQLWTIYHTGAYDKYKILDKIRGLDHEKRD